MKWLKKWSYLLLLTGMGIIYLTCVDKWQVYAKPLQEAKNWYASVWQQDVLPVFGGNEEKEDGTVGDGEILSADSGTQRAQGTDGIPSDDETAGTSNETGAAGEDVPSALLEEGVGDGSGSAGESPEDGEVTGPLAEGAEGGNQENPGDNPQEENGEIPGEENNGGLPEGQSGPALPVYTTVEDDYFADAVFIGDSRTVGLFEYAGLEETAAFYASTGLTVYKMFDSAIVSVPGERKKITVEEALQQNTFAKIYLMVGINEMGTGTVETFLEKYQEVVAHLQELQPDAIIYVQAIIKVTTERSGQGDYINNEGIMARNEGIQQMADNEKIFYLDVNPLICDETGGMISDYTFDGVHLKAKYIEIWKDYLKTHAISS